MFLMHMNTYEQPDGEKEYKTCCLDEIAALLLRKQKILHTQQDEGTVWFVFQHSAEIEKLARDFYFGRLLVNAREYHEILKMLLRKVKPNR